jgi:hypothetical protein
MSCCGVTKLCMSAGPSENTIDLRAEVIIKDNSELLGLLELVKAMESVKDVIWSEIVDVIGKKRSIPSSIIDKL